MIPQAFDYYAPTSVADALRLLRQHGDDAKLLAGGHSLLPIMKLRLSTPQCLIDLGRIPELRFIREEDDGGLTIGAMTTYHDLMHSAAVKARVPALAEAAGEVGDVQVQNKGTIGGSLAHADPAGDLPAVALALGVELVTATPRASRTLGDRSLLPRSVDNGAAAHRDSDRDSRAGPPGPHRRCIQEAAE